MLRRLSPLILAALVLAGLACTADQATLRVGAARADITPDLSRAETEWSDTNGNGLWDEGESFVDRNGNGEFDAVWLAGFGSGRVATGVHSSLSVRAIVFDRQGVRVAFAVVDAIGWMVDEIDRTRAALDDSLGIDHLIVASTHTHEGPDTMGLWGPRPGKPGTDPAYQRMVREKTAQAIAEAVARMRPVRMQVAVAETIDEQGRTLPFVGDGRDPIVIDPEMTLLRFTDANDASDTLATLVHWAAHPEYSGRENNRITADFPSMLREVVERELGGEVVYVNGALGGQIGPHGTGPIGADGVPITRPGLARADALGVNLGQLALQALREDARVVPAPSTNLSFRTAEIELEIANSLYHMAIGAQLFDRDFFGYDRSQPMGAGNLPRIASRVTYLEVGPVGFATVPGELHPELAIGGYDGSKSFGATLVHPDNPNPPALDRAPGPPYLKQMIEDNPGIEHGLIVGLGEDMIGYIVPSYNYLLDPEQPYLAEPDGDHYEETNSVGPAVESQALDPLRQLIRQSPS